MGRTQFIVNPNPKYIDKDADSYILLNESVLRDENKHILKGKFSVLQYREKREQEYLAAKDYIRELTDRVAGHYGQIMSEFTGISLSVRQWKYYIGIWLMDFLFDAYDRYMKIKSIHKSDVYTVVGGTGPVLPNQREYGFLNGYDLDYQMYLYAYLFRLLNKPVRIMQDNAAGRIYNRVSKSYVKWKTRLHIVIKNPEKLINKFSKNREKQINTDTGNVLVVESRMSGALEDEITRKCGKAVTFLGGTYFWAQMNPIVNKKNADFQNRKKWLKGFWGKNEFERMVDSLLIHFLPVSFFEAFSQLYAKAKEITQNWNYKKIYHSAHITELFALCCALMKDKGALICDIQHSAAYNALYCIGFKEFEVWDRFLTWGWHLDERHYHNVYPVAMSRLPLERSRNRKVKEKILLATGIPELSDSGAGWSYESYVRQQKEFVSNLSEEMRKKLVIRVRTDNPKMSGGFISWCKKNYPCVKFEMADEISFTDSLLESRLLVCDYFGSSHLEALMLGKVFTMFEGAHIIVHNPAIKKYISEMKNIGLYQIRGKDLAIEISSHTDIDKWLMSPKIRTVQNEYMNAMTNSDKNIAGLWASEFLGDGCG